MPFNGSGTFSRLYSWIVDAANSVNISSTRTDAEMNGFAAGLTNCVTRDGQSPPSADLPMGGKKLTNLGAATVGTDALNRDTADARYPSAPNGVYGGSWSVQTPNSGTTGGLQLRGNATSGFAYEQITDATAMTQWGVWQYDSSGNASWSGTLKVGTNVAWHAGNLNAAALNTIYGFTTASQAYVTSALSPYAPLASPALTGAPTAPTASAATSTTQLATTAFVQGITRPSFPGNVSASFSAADADNNTHKVASGAAQTLTLGSLTAGTAFTIRFTTAWSIACAGGLSKNGAAPGAVTTGSIAANSLITFLHEGAGVWDATGQGLT